MILLNIAYFEQLVFCCCLHKENFLILIKSVDFAGDKLKESNKTWLTDSLDPLSVWQDSGSNFNDNLNMK